MIELDKLSGLGFGCHFINTKENEHEKALIEALDNGCQIIDTSSNYQQGMAEQLLGKALKSRDRSSYFLMSKGGSLSGEILVRFNQSLKDKVPANEIVQISGQNYHCIHPIFLESQIEHSLSVMNQTYLDGYFLHNPEYYLESENADKEEFYRRIGSTFEFLEEQVTKGKIRFYGISESSGKVDVERLFQIAKSISPSHHFKLMQFPFNATQKPFSENTSGKNIFELLKENGAIAFGNRPLSARKEGKTYRLIGRELKGIGKEKVLEAMDGAFYALEQYAESLSEPVDISESSIIQFLYSGWENIPDDSAFVAMKNLYLDTYLLQISNGKVDDKVTQEMDIFSNTLIGYLQDKVTNRSEKLMNELGLQEVFNDPNGATTLCKQYFDEGIDVVLCGMTRSKYVRQLSELF